MVEVKYLTSATAIFNNLQSGLARPYWEVNITVSGEATTVCGTLGAAYAATNDIVSMGTIDREKPITVSGMSRIYSGDVSFTLQNRSGTYSPLATASIFTDAGGSALDWIHSTVNVWAGFENVSGTAYVIQRGSFLVTKLQIDSEKRVAYLSCQDAAKIPLENYVGLPQTSGTATTWYPTSGSSTQSIMSELLSAISLTAGQYDLATGMNFSLYSLQETKVSDAIGALAQANDGYVYTNGKGQIVFKLNDPKYGGLHGGLESKMPLADTTRILKLRYTIDSRNILNYVQVKFTSGLSDSRSSSNVLQTKGRDQIVSNEYIELPAHAMSMSSRLLGQFDQPRPFLELTNIFLPSLEIGDVVTITDAGTNQVSVAYEIYHIRENITKCSTDIFAISDLRIGSKWGFCSTSDVANCGTTFTDSWHSGFAFACAENTGFDDDGNNDNAITTGFDASGAGTTGIELPYVAY